MRFDNPVIPLCALLLIAAACWVPVPGLADATGDRAHNAPHFPARKITKQFAAGANNFPTANPDPDGTPLTESNATGVSGLNGTVTLELTDGFTAPVTLTAFMWDKDKHAWVRIAPTAAAYSVSVDAHYTLLQFAIPNRIPFLIQSSAAVTGDVFVEGPQDAANPNTATGYPTNG